MFLTVLDQTPVFAGAGPAVAARETVALAGAIERLGYHRFWIAEHHAATAGCGSPEILVAAAGETTSTLRVGSGAVLLPYYSPLKVATTFNLLSRLFPGRVDLGVGRGPGASPQTADLLSEDGPASFDPKLAALLGFLLETEADTAVLPRATPPQVWVTGGGPGGAQIAAKRGLPFAFAQFVHDSPQPQWAELYRQQFRSATEAPARFSLAVRVACADSRDDVRALGAFVGWLQSADHHTYAVKHRAMPSWSELRELPALQPRQRSMSTLVGTPPEIQEQLGKLIAAYRPDELAITTACPPFDLRVRSFELVKHVCGELFQ